MVVHVVLAIDIGPTEVKAAVKGYNDPRLFQSCTFKRGGYWETLEEILRVFDNPLFRENSRIIALGVSIACHVVNEVTVEDTNMPGWAGRQILNDILDVFNVSFGIVRNNGVMGGLGAFSVLQTSLVYVDLGARVDVGFIARSPSGDIAMHASRLGHHIIDYSPSARKCTCGGLGHWEAYSGGANLELQWGCPPDQMTDEQWSRQLSVDAIGLRNLSATFPGEPIVLGGERFWQQRHRFNELCQLVSVLPSSAPVPELIPAPYETATALHGAAFAAQKLVWD